MSCFVLMQKGSSMFYDLNFVIVLETDFNAETSQTGTRDTHRGSEKICVFVWKCR